MNINYKIALLVILLTLSSCNNNDKPTDYQGSKHIKNNTINSEELAEKHRDSVWNVRCIYFDSLNKKYNKSIDKNLNYLKDKEISVNSILQFKLGQTKEVALPLLEEYCIKHNVELVRNKGVSYDTYYTTDSLQLSFRTNKDSSYLEEIASASKNICLENICKWSSFEDVIKKIKLEDNGNAAGYLKVSGTSLYIVFIWNEEFTEPLKIRDFWITENPQNIP